MNEIIIKRDDSLTIIRKTHVECVWRKKVLRDRSYHYYVATTGGNTYEINKYEYSKIIFMMTLDK